MQLKPCVKCETIFLPPLGNYEVDICPFCWEKDKEKDKDKKDIK